MRTRRIITVGVAALALATATVPAKAATTGDTSATFSITAGSLAVSVPQGPVALGSVAAGATSVSGSLGNVTVTDDRGALVAVWTATVSSTDFTTGAGGANEKVAKAAIAYGSGAASATSGTGTFVPGTVASLAVPGAGAAWAVGVGVNSATWNPTITFTLVPGRVVGTYSGTITHSVA